VLSYHDPCIIPTANFNIYVNDVMITGTPICGTGSITTGKWGAYRPRVWQCVHDAISEAVASQGSECAAYKTNFQPAVQCSWHLSDSAIEKIEEVQQPFNLKYYGANFTCGGAPTPKPPLMV